jgi:NAD-dependent SIR2 family protein deacetylase
MIDSSQITQLRAMLQRTPRIFVLTGAGISVGSGIPEYRDVNGNWKRPAPVQFRDFLRQPGTRKRYWARSLVGWPWFSRARPNLCHLTLARWQSDGLVGQLVTQNVDRLHQAAGGNPVIDLHGRLDRVVCLDCSALFERHDIQRELLAMNPGFTPREAVIAPDGDAAVDILDVDAFRVPDCPNCGGILKPDVVFFGETIPKTRADAAVAALHAADALLVIGSSLMVYSGFRFCRVAAEHGMPVVAINPGKTRADGLFTLKIDAGFEDVIAALGNLSHDPPGFRHESTR